MPDRRDSYVLDDFDDDAAELGRLAKQAHIATKREHDLLVQAGLTADMHVLDLGCGPGWMSVALAQIATEGHVTGVDVCEKLLTQARQTVQLAHLTNVHFTRRDVYTLDLPPDTYDFVYARFLFQHLHEPHRALQSIHRVLKPGGILCVFDVDDDWLSVFPEPASFAGFISRAAAKQKRHGGDRYVGRKLGTYLLGAGFQQIAVQVESLSSQDIGMKDFLDIAVTFRHGQFPKSTPADVDQDRNARDDIATLLETPESMGCLGMFFVTGCK